MLLLKKITHATTGIHSAIQQEIHFRIEIGCAFIAVTLGLLAKITTTEWMILIITIGFVLVTEMVNTAFEEICDKFHPEHDPHIAKIKDLAAGAVLLSVLCAGCVGTVLFLPKFLIM